ncbi:MAG: DUF2158 domain-containing protein [Planctomycetota bacterium]
MEKQFKEGDIVCLKSGGPEMTVRDAGNKTGNVICQWFAGKKLEQGYFSPATLVAVEPDEEDGDQ